MAKTKTKGAAKPRAQQRATKPAAKKAATAKKRAKPTAKKAAGGTRDGDSAVDAVSELVSVLACPKAAVNELALSCENVLDLLDVSCGFARFTGIAWNARPAPYGVLGDISRALVAEYERHASVLGALLDRLAPLAEEDEHADHEDLDPMDVFARVSPLLAQSEDTAG